MTISPIMTSAGAISFGLYMRNCGESPSHFALLINIFDLYFVLQSKCDTLNNDAIKMMEIEQKLISQICM